MGSIMSVDQSACSVFSTRSTLAAIITAARVNVSRHVLHLRAASDSRVCDLCPSSDYTSLCTRLFREFSIANFSLTYFIKIYTSSHVVAARSINFNYGIN